MPATPNVLAKSSPPLLPGPPLAKRVAVEKSAAADFRQVFAIVKPDDADSAKTVAPIEMEVGKPKISLLNTAPLQSSGTKRLKKSAESNLFTAPMQQNAAAPAAVVSTLEKTAIPASITTAAPQPESLGPVPVTAAPVPAASIAANAAKLNPAIIIHGVKQGTPEAAPAKLPATPIASSNIGSNTAATATEKPAPASLASPKSTVIIRQIAAAFSKTSAANATINPALHISLTPEALGTITVKISQHASGETAVTITASQPETLAALKHDAPNLNQILTNAGVPEASRQINFQTMPVAPAQISGGLSGGGQPGQGNANAQQQQSGTAFASVTPRPISAPVANTLQPRSNPARGVDVIA